MDAAVPTLTNAGKGGVMSRFMRELLAKADAVDPTGVAGPSLKVADGETVVGVLPDELRALWAVQDGMLLAFMAEVDSIVAEEKREKGTGANEPSPALKARLEASKAQSECLDTAAGVFWTSVRYEFPALAGKDNIGVRTGWEVVWFTKPLEAIIGIVKISSPGHSPRSGLLDMILGRRGRSK